MSGSYLFFFSSCIFVELTAKSMYRNTELKIFMISLQQLDMSLPSSVISLSPFHPPLLSFFPLSLSVFLCVWWRGERKREESEREIEKQRQRLLFAFFFLQICFVFSVSRKNFTFSNYTHLQSHLLKYFFLSYGYIRSKGHM